MSTRIRAAIPLLPRPPAEYDPKWAAELQRTFSQFVDAILTPGEGRNTFIVLTDLQDDDIGLEAGSLYKDGNTIRVSVLDIAALRSASMTGSVGSVTVLTP